MVAISDADKQAIGALWAQMLEANGAAAIAAPAAAPGFDPKSVFCKDWLTAKQVLQALQVVVPQPGPIIIGLVVSAGDAAHQKICA